MKYKVDLDGIEQINKRLGIEGAQRVRRQVGDDVKEGVYKMAEAASANAPVETSALQNSILPTVHKYATFSWRFGSTLPYAQRQNYEHKTHMYYFERAVNAEIFPLKSKLEYTIKRKLR